MATVEERNFVNSKLRQQLGVMRSRMRNRPGQYCWYNNNGVIDMKNVTMFTDSDAQQFDVVGVYTGDIDSNVLRDDLMWYIENVMEEYL